MEHKSFPPFSKFSKNLLTEWRKLELPFENETIVVAVSGGADSVSLALALHELKVKKKIDLRFIIAHFNHNLRGIESDNDAEFVKDLAKKLKFEFIQQIQNPKSKIQYQKGNLEQNARFARYEFLSQVAEKHQAYAILTAHTQNDQAETFLLNLIRGSGLQGLSGMRNSRFQISDSKFQTRLVRPLLNWAKREETERFCLENEIKFRQDAMNDDLKFSRVRIRKEIIPLLQKINPSIIETLSNTANILREDDQQLSEISQKLSKNITQKELKLLSKSMRLRVLRDWLRDQRGSLRQIELNHLKAIESLMFSRKSGKIIELPKGEKVVKSDGKIFFEKSRVEKSRSDN